MTPYLLPALRDCGAYAWEVTQTRTQGWEFYFIRHLLDQHRVREVTHTTVRILTLSEDGTEVGSASSEIQESADEQETRDLLDRLLFQSSLVRNPAYTLHAPSPVKPMDLPVPDVASMARDFIQTMQRLPETEYEDINSYEIFVNLKTRHFMNSEGIDLTETFPSSMMEVVVNARQDGHEIELYRSYTSGSCDPDALVRDLTDTLRYGRDRLAAQMTPEIQTSPLLLSTKDAVEVYRYFSERMSANMKYQRLSDWELGQVVTESKLTLKALREMPNSSENHAFDAEGAPIRDLVLIDQGKAVAFWGSRQYAEYLGIHDAFIAGNFAIEDGGETEAALRSTPYLEVVEFSDFQVDELTGDIAGEIRLGYWHDGETVRIVSGGSVSGNMREAPLRFSADRRQYDSFRIPAVTRLEGIHITGIAGA